MYLDTVTLFSQFNGVWYPTIIEGCDFNADRARIVAKFGENSQDRAILHCRIEDGRIAGKTLMSPKQWHTGENQQYAPQGYDSTVTSDGQEFITAATPAAAITFDSGNTFSFFWLGEWPDEEPISDSDYLDGFYDYMNSARDGVYAVSSASVYSVIPHVEVTGR